MAESQDSTVPEIPKGFCQCGCGMRTKIAQKSNTKRGWIKDEPKDFVWGHHAKGDRNPNWNGGIKIRRDGYVYIRQPENPRSTKEGYVMKHILIAEQALRKSLPPQAEVHHVNGKRDDNRPENLVICEDVAYHRLLHMRGRALKACGNAHWRKCPFCKRYDDPCNMIPASAKGNAYVHQSCRNAYGREYFHRNKTISRLERKKMDTED